MTNTKILLVEDDPLQAKTTKEYLQKAGYDIVWAENGIAAMKLTTIQSFDLIMLETTTFPSFPIGLPSALALQVYRNRA